MDSQKCIECGIEISTWGNKCEGCKERAALISSLQTEKINKRIKLEDKLLKYIWILLVIYIIIQILF